MLITPSQVVESIELEVDPAFSMSGRVVQMGGQGIEDVAVVAARTRAPANDSASTDAKWSFQIVGLNPGEYSLTAVNGTNMVKIDTPIAIRHHDVGDVVIEIDVGVTISGRVEPARVTVVGLQLAVEDGGDLNHYTRAGKTRVATDTTGAFSLEGIPNGNFEVVAATADGHFGLTAITAADVAQSGVVVTLTLIRRGTFTYMAMPSRAELLKLDVATRLELIEELWDSIANDPVAASQLPLTDAERDLLAERLREHRDNPTAARPWAEVRAEILKTK